MAPGDVDPNIFSGKWRLSLADYFMPKRKAPAAPAAEEPCGTAPGQCCAPGCCN